MAGSRVSRCSVLFSFYNYLFIVLSRCFFLLKYQLFSDGSKSTAIPSSTCGQMRLGLVWYM